jgi:hypothetical protein
MKQPITYLSILLIMSLSGQASDNSIRMSSRLKPYIAFDDSHYVMMRNHRVIIRTENIVDGKVIIDEEFELIADRDTVSLNEEQQKLVFEYYQLVDESMESARNIGWEGAKIGAQGATIGIKAITGVFRMILPNYGSEDFERDMEDEASKIEAKAAILEEKAQVIDEKLNRLQELHEQLRENIPELKRLEWF